MKPRVRPARAADAPTIIEFNRRLAEESEGKRLDPDLLARGVAAGLADDRKASYLVAEADGTVLGQLMLTREWSDWRAGWIWWIQSVYVRQEWRRRGVLRALFQHVQALAQADAEVVGLRLYVERENHAAHQAYLRLGMAPTSYIVLERYPL